MFPYGGFRNKGTPIVLIHFRLGFSMISTIHFGTPPMVFPVGFSGSKPSKAPMTCRVQRCAAIAVQLIHLCLAILKNGGFHARGVGIAGIYLLYAGSIRFAINKWWTAMLCYVSHWISLKYQSFTFGFATRGPPFPNISSGFRKNNMFRKSASSSRSMFDPEPCIQIFASYSLLEFWKISRILCRLGSRIQVSSLSRHFTAGFNTYFRISWNGGHQKWMI